MHIRDAENLTVVEAIELFRISRTKLYELISQGQVDAVKLGRRTLIRANSVRALMDRLPPPNADHVAELAGESERPRP